MYLKVVILLHSLPELLEIRLCQLARAQDLVLLVHPKADGEGGVDQPVPFQHLPQPLRLVLLALLWRAEGQVVVLVRLTGVAEWANLQTMRPAFQESPLHRC